MKFLITSSAGKLLALLSQVVGVVSKRGTLPILGNILIQSEGTDTLQVTGSDMEIEIKAADKVGVIDGRVNVTVDARKLVEILKTLPADQSVYLEPGRNQQTTVRGTGFKFNLASLPAEDFPHIDLKSDDPVTLEIAAEMLHSALDRVDHAQGVSDVRYYLNGTLLSLVGNKIDVVATDGHRMALAELPSPVATSSERHFILSRKAVAELKRMLASHSGEARLVLDKRHVQVICGETVMAAKLIEGKFPMYRRIIPNGGYACKLQMETKRFGDLARQVSIITGPDFKGVRFNLVHTPEGERLRMEASNTSLEDAQVTAPVDLEGADAEVGLNIGYVLDLLPSLKGEDIVMNVSPNHGTVVFTDPKEDSFLCLVMPMKL